MNWMVFFSYQNMIQLYDFKLISLFVYLYIYIYIYLFIFYLFTYLFTYSFIFLCWFALIFEIFVVQWIHWWSSNAISMITCREILSGELIKACSVRDTLLYTLQLFVLVGCPIFCFNSNKIQNLRDLHTSIEAELFLSTDFIQN